MSIFITQLAFINEALIQSSKMMTLLASCLAGLLGFLFYKKKVVIELIKLLLSLIPMSASLKSNIERKLEHPIEDEHLDMLLKLMFKKSFDKKDLLIEEGNKNNYIYFIEQGSCFSYLTEANGEKQVVQFAIEGNWISDLNSFFSEQKAVYSLEALEPLKTLALNKQNFKKACDTIPWFDRFFRVLIQNAYISIQYRLVKTNSEEIEARYKEFSKLHPHFIQRIPQYLIASYLGVKPQSLSRMRKETAHKA